MNESMNGVLARPQCSNQTVTDDASPHTTGSTAPNVPATSGAIGRFPLPIKIDDSSGNNSDKGGNNSDGTNNSNSSAIAGLSTSDYFGFNFEEDSNMMNGGGRAQNTENSDSDGSRGRGFGGGGRNKGMMIAQRKNIGFGHLTGGGGGGTGGAGVAAAGNGSLQVCKSEDQSHDGMGAELNKPSHEAAAAAAVANLQSIACESVQTPFNSKQPYV